jgi:hypothetical protein
MMYHDRLPEITTPSDELMITNYCSHASPTTLATQKMLYR